MNFKTLSMIFSFIVMTFLNHTALAVQKVDASVPNYEVVSGVSGNLFSVGSDTLANLMTFWAESFIRSYPNVNIQIQASGSKTAPPALIEATSNIGPMSRKMKDIEIDAFEKKYGYKPTPIPVAIDALAVYVNKANPIQGLTIAQVDAIMSSTRKCGYSTDIKKWGDVGLDGAWKQMPIQLYGRNRVSGTYDYFKKKVLCKGSYKNSVNEQPGSASVIQSVTLSLNGIGYSGIGYKSSKVKAVPLSKKADQAYIKATPENALTGHYPLSRFLYIYVNKQPNKPLALLEQEFIKMVLSKTGQEIVIKDGYIPLPEELVSKSLDLIR